MTEQQKQSVMNLVGLRTDGIKYNLEIIYSEDTTGLLDFPMFYGVVSSLDEQTEYYYKEINTVEDFFEFVETVDEKYNLLGMNKVEELV